MATNHHQHGPLSGQRIRTVGDPNETITVTGQDGKTGASREISYTNCKVVGNGAFGVVVSARVVKIRSPTAPAEAGQPEEEERIAIKKVLQDPNYKNRELQIMRAVQHPNVVDLRAYFYSKGDKDEVYLNLVLECMPETLYAATRFYAKQKQSMPMVYVKVYMYQLMRALAYIHTLGICHRDIKPQNIIVDPASGMLKLIDFGSAKVITVGQPNVSYIASRYYRAPEAIFGATDYTVAIDIWAAGCTVAELMLGQPPFLGESGVDQLVEIIKVLGTPTKEEVKTMNPKYVDYKFPSIKAIPFSKVFRPRTPADAVDFTSKLLIYRPASRLTAIEALCHPFMDELRAEGGRLPNGQPLPPLFDFTPTELSARPDLIPQLVPEHAEADLRARGIDVDTFVPTPLRDLRISVD